MYLDEKAKVIFEKTNLSQASFLDTNLEQIQFRDSIWHHKGRRRALWDESPRENYQPDYEKVAENYRQLVLTYDAKRDFDSAEEFHIGEMEMRRKKCGGKTRWHWWRVVREWTNGYALYKLASNYGTSYWQGLFVLTMLLAVFSAIFLCVGLEPSKENPLNLTPINYDLCLNASCQWASWQKWVPDYTKTLLFTLSLLTFQKERLYEPANEWTLLWVSIAVLVMAGQTALVLFAIRRRFKR